MAEQDATSIFSASQDASDQAPVPIKLRTSVQKIISLVTVYVGHGLTSQATRLARWLAKRPNGSAIATNLSSVTYYTIIEPLSSKIVKGSSKAPKSGSNGCVKLHVPSMVAMTVWCHELIRATHDAQAREKIIKSLAIGFFSKQATSVGKLYIDHQAKLSRADRAQLTHYWMRLLSLFKSCSFEPFMLYVFAYWWQVALLLDSIGRKRATRFFTYSLLSAFDDYSLSKCLGALVEHAYHGDMDLLCHTKTQDIYANHFVDANALAPLYIMLFKRIFAPKGETYTREDYDAMIDAYISLRNTYTLGLYLPRDMAECVLRIMNEWVTASISIGCLVQTVDVVKASIAVLDLPVHRQVKRVTLSYSAKQVMMWNTCPGLEACLKRMEACVPFYPGTCLQRMTSWVARVEQNPHIKQDLIRALDVSTWLSFAVGDDSFSEDTYICLPKWCASPNIPPAPSDEVMEAALVKAFTQKFRRGVGQKSFSDQWLGTSMSTSVETVMEHCLPGWMSAHRQVVSRVWRKVYDQLVRSLCPEAIRDGMLRGIHPHMIKIVNAYLAKIENERVRADVMTVFDFCSWSVWSGSVDHLPAFAYLYESVYRLGMPIQIYVALHEGDDAMIGEWLECMDPRRLLSWSLGMRAQQVLLGKVTIPNQVARACVKALLLRKDAGKYKAWLTKRCVKLGE